MAGRKSRGNVAQRDLEFIRIAQVAKDKRAQAASQEPKPPIAEESTVSAPQAQLAPPPAQSSESAAPSKPEPAAKAKRTAVPATHTPTPAPTRGADSVSVRVWVRIPDDLMDRAAVWAKDSGVPTSKVITKAFSEYKPYLVAELEDGLARDGVDFSRGEGGRQSYDGRVRLDRDLYERLRARHDPNDLVGMNLIVSRWARDKFAVFFEEWLTGLDK